MRRFIEIVAHEGEEVIHRIDITGRTERAIELVERGMNINLNHEKYYTREVSE